MARAPTAVSPPVLLRPIARWLLPFGAVAAAVIVVVPLQALYPNAAFLSVFAWPAPMVTYLAGQGPGILTVALAAAAGAYITLPPAFSFVIYPSGYPALAVFLIVGLGLWWGAQYVRRLEWDRYALYEGERRRATEHAALAQLSALSLEGVGEQPLMQRAAEITAEHLRVEFASVFQLRADPRRLTPAATVGWKPGYVERANAAAAAGLSPQARDWSASNAVVVIDDLRPDSGFAHSPVLAEQGAVSGLTVTIPGALRVLGLLGAHSTRPRAFTAHESSFLKDVAGILATVLLRHASDVAIREREERLRATLAREQQAHADTETAVSRLAFLAHAGEALASTLDFTQTLANVASVAVPTFADWCAFDLQLEDGRLERVAVHHRDPAKVGIARELLRRYPPHPDLPRGAYEVLRTGRARLFPEITETMIRETSQDDAHFELMRQMGLHSVMIVPLAARGRPIGALSLAWAESRRRYTEDDLAIAVELGRRAALFVDNARLYDRERRIASTLQEAFLPTSLPHVPGFSLDVDFVSGSDEANLGGDWYDVFWLPDGRVGFSIGDVMGRGLRAAGFMGLVRQTIRAGAYDRDSAAAILSRANHLLRLDDRADKATALVAILDPATSRLTYASAGHPAPLAATPDGDIASGPPGGPPLGLARMGEQYEDRAIALSPGTLVVLYTDGLIEYERDPVSGERKLREALEHERRHPTAKPAGSVRRRVMGDVERHDDVALMTIGVLGTPLTDLELTFPAIPGSLPIVRQAITRFLAACGVDSERTAALQVAIGEAANNVIEHAYGALRGTLAVRARQVGRDVVVEVTDHGTWRRGRMDGGGRGLQIMRGLADEVDITSDAGGTTVRLVLLETAPTAARDMQPSNQ